MLSYIIVIVQLVFVYGRPNSNNPELHRNVAVANQTNKKNATYTLMHLKFFLTIL